jgi:hypothetical protein
VVSSEARTSTGAAGPAANLFTWLWMDWKRKVFWSAEPPELAALALTCAEFCV